MAILLATHDGERYLDEQLDTILGQEGVDVTVFASDDASTDATPALLAQRAATDDRLVLLPPTRQGSAHGNFRRLLIDVDPSPFDAVGLADQDDRWLPGRLARQLELLREGPAAVSSDVVMFDERGRRTTIVKSRPQVRFDYLLESAGPGSTFLLAPDAAALVHRVLRDDPRTADVGAHDWLIYAIVRGAGLRWHIDPQPTVEYRQHDANVLGANRGLAAALERGGRIVNGWLRAHATRVGEIVLALQPEPDPALADIVRIMRLGRREQWRLARRARWMRRNPREARIVAACMRLGLW
ncbi:glycosyltransferase [Agrococcus sp. HG114]|uniref:glycosyltransferase n=1 Tax=Agrococcus sp. HG114 TaxID=2969757 RepID=UPI00215B1ED9|nr:glycosyltransferase [Agrococcus sp. HG114]MCR8670428.1 glycosyltransferase [Agrococcus sp. HG114]